MAGFGWVDCSAGNGVHGDRGRGGNVESKEGQVAERGSGDGAGVDGGMAMARRG